MNTEFGSRRSEESSRMCFNGWLGRLRKQEWLAVSMLFIAMAAFSACSSSSPGANKTTSNAATVPPDTPRPAKTGAASVPKSLVDAGEYGENIYDYAKANDWKKVDAKLAALKDAARKVRTDVKNQSAPVDSLDMNVAALDRAVSAKDRQAAMREANQVTLDIADMTTAYKLSVPVEVTKLDYYGRELEIWAEAKDANKLQATSREMRHTWNALRPSIEAHSAAEAKKFEALIAQVESAKAPSDYANVAKPVLDEVDNLEKLFA